MRTAISMLRFLLTCALLAVVAFHAHWSITLCLLSIFIAVEFNSYVMLKIIAALKIQAVAELADQQAASFLERAFREGRVPGLQNQFRN